MRMAKGNPVFISIQEIAEVLGCGKTKAWQIKDALNAELRQKGWYIPFRAKTYRRYFKERMMIQ